MKTHIKSVLWDTKLAILATTGKNGPSCKVIPEIVGWIHACGYRAVIKPESVAACSIADKYSK